MIPEDLEWASADQILDIANVGFNYIRMGYAIEMIDQVYLSMLLDTSATRKSPTRSSKRILAGQLRQPDSKSGVILPVSPLPEASSPLQMFIPAKRNDAARIPTVPLGSTIFTLMQHTGTVAFPTLLTRKETTQTSSACPFATSYASPGTSPTYTTNGGRL
jgi:hypothetical protein